jgi:hypothetical protein
MNLIFVKCLDLDNDDSFLLATFVLSTWFIDRLPVAPYLALVGLPRSGKSTVLRVLSMLCRRSLLTADITSAALYRACDRLMPTLLIDETATAGEKRVLFHLLRTGISRDLVALRRDQSFKSFGAKAVSWIETPNDADLNSRCIIIGMHETKRTDLARPSDPDIVAAADLLRQQLLGLRLANYRHLTSERVPGGECLQGRTRDLYDALGLPWKDVEFCRTWLLRCCQLQQNISRGPLRPAYTQLLRYLDYCIYYIEVDKNWCEIKIGKLTSGLNSYLGSGRRDHRFKPREVGAALTAFGFLNRKRTRDGWEISLDDDSRKRIHELIDSYGIDYRSHEEWQGHNVGNWAQRRHKCEYCSPKERSSETKFGPQENLNGQKRNPEESQTPRT